MGNYYRKVDGDLKFGHIAKSSDINLMQKNIGDGFKSLISDHHEHSSYILGHDEHAFQLTPAPKRLGRYIDTMNLVESGNEEWLSIRKWGYRQKIKKSKTSLYSIICKFRNLSSEPITVWCGLQKIEDKTVILRVPVEIPAETESAEFEVVFDQKYLSTAPGVSHTDLEVFDSKYVAPPPREESFDQGISHEGEQDLNNFTIGSSEVYFIIEPLNIDETDIAINGDEYDVITDETFAVLADKSGSYGKGLEEKGGLNYTETNYDLYFKDIYATTSTYLCEMGEAIIDGIKVKCIDTHVSIAGFNDFGNVNTYIYMDIDGHLRAINSPAFIEDKETTTMLPGAILPIAIITTYMNDTKEPYVYQDDTELKVRPRSHHERIRRLEKKVNYISDIAIPPRLKYTYSGSDLIDENPAGEIGKIDSGNCYLTTDAKGNVVVKSSKAEVISIPITLKEEITEKIDNTSDINSARNLAELTEMEHDKEKGTLKLKTTQEKTKGSVGTTDEAAKETEFNPWDDDASNRPANSDITPTEREYVVVKGKNGKNDSESEFPAMTFYTEKDYNLTGLHIPITKFKNCESIKFIIWKRQGPNNKTNEVWFEKKIYTSESFSLENAKAKDDYQIMEDGFTIKIDNGLTLPKGQYVIVCFHTAKEGKGSCFVETYKPANPKDFCIRYYGASDGSHFLLKERYHEIWYNSASFKGTEAKLASEGSVTSGTVTWDNEEPISKIIANANITTPEKCSYELFADTGGGFQKLEIGKETTMTGGGVSFKWKLVFKGDGDTPVLEFNEDKGYAIQFTLTRKQPEVGTYNDKNECITTKTFRGEDILKEYIGDPNFNQSGDRFSNFEFARIWASENSTEDNRLLIDIAASDETAEITYPVTENNQTIDKTVTADIFSLIYADLLLDDFNVESVDYSNYDNQVESDEHNLRLKLDTNHSYNDSNINILDAYTQTLYPTDGIEIGQNDFEMENVLEFTEGSAPAENKIILKRKIENNYTDLTKYSAIRLKLSMKGTVGNDDDKTLIKGLGLYISSAEEEDPISLKNDSDDIEVIHGVGNLPNLNDNKEDIIKQYYGKILRVEDTINDVEYIGYFRYVKDSNGNYSLQQIHDLKSYNLYKLPNIVYDESTKGSSDWATQSIDIDINANSINLKNVKELGLVALSDDGFEIVKSCSLVVGGMQVIQNDYYPIYDPSTNKIFEPFREDLATEDNHYSTELQTETLTNEKKARNAIPQKRCKIDIYYDRISSDGEILAYYPIEKSTEGFKHIGLQLAANCWIPKNALEIHFCSDSKGKQSVHSIRVPTLNTIHDPIKSTVTRDKDDGFVKFSQIFTKVREDVKIRSISIRAATRFKSYMKKIRVNSESEKISLYVGKIVLYKAESIPIFHKNMRFKLYNNNMNNSNTSAFVRKVGCVLEYK